MLRLLARRASVQFPLLVAVVAVVAVGTTLLGVCALLLTRSADQALTEGMARATAPEVAVTAYLADVPAAKADSVAGDTRALLTRTLAPFQATSATRASSAVRLLGDRTGAARPDEPRKLAYLSGIDGLQSRARLTAGRWPRSTGAAPIEAVVLQPTARVLDLAVGSRVRLGTEITSRTDAVTVVIVGIFQPLPNSGWDRDPLAATGYDPAYLDGSPNPAIAYGPFVVDLSDLFASGSTIDRLQVTTQPQLARPTGPELDAVAATLGTANAQLRKLLGDRAKFSRVASDLPVTFALARAQQAVTRSTVLVVVLIGTVLTAAALGLAGRLVVALRATETALLSELGASRGQLAAATASEAIILSAIAAVLAVPLSSLTHAALTHLPALADAGLATSPSVTGAQLMAVGVGAVLLAGVLVIPALRRDPEPTTGRSRLGLLTRSGADLLLLALAAIGWWQLRTQPAAQAGTDTVRVLAPVLCLLAGAALAPRLVMLPLRAGDSLARRSRGVVLALAAFEAARRPRAIAAALLLSLAAATGTFGLAFGATWQQSQQDQADARVGTDLALALTVPPTIGQGSVVGTATGGAVSPVTDRGVVIGRYFGTAGAPPRLVAVDTTRAGLLLRGRIPGTSWSQVGAGLAPKTPAGGVPIPVGGDSALTITGTSTGASRLQAVPRLVLEDRSGLRTSCEATAVRLDGRSHPLHLCSPVREAWRVVAISLQVNFDPPGQVGAGESRLTVSVTLPAGPNPGTGTWPSRSVGNDPWRLGNVATAIHSTPTSTVVTTTANVNTDELQPTLPVEVVSTAFAAPSAVPVAVSDRLADEVGAVVGGRLTVTVGGIAVPMVISQRVPTVPSAPGEVAMLADVDALSRALISAGALEPAVDAWWVGQPSTPGAAAATTALGLGEVDTRAGVHQELSRGPLRVGLPAALDLLVPAAVLLLLVGTIMHVTSEVEARALEMARLRGLGLRRRSILGGLLAQHGGVLVLLLSAGAVVGAVASWAVAPLLIRSDLGARPEPGAVLQWPWPAEVGLLAGLLIGGTVAVTLVIAVQLRRADAAHLRVGA
ncbi:MAG TPA: hypothetical protein VLL08_21775 [Kineosporiaceae bacterium]|nr:hypothetical protein [Kineosporiaceae bacterium]